MTLVGWRGYAHVPTVGVDTTPPSIPGNVLATYVGKFVTITADSSTDDVDVLGYKLYRNGVSIKPTFADPPVFTDQVSAGTYAYTITAVDTSLNESDPSDPSTLVVTDTPDTTDPTVPGSVHATVDATTHVVTLTWTASTDDRAVIGYVIRRDGVGRFTSRGPTLSWTETLEFTGTYAYTVEAFDAANNHSDPSTPSSVTVTIAPPPDTDPPSKPTFLSAAYDGTHVNVAWNLSSDNVGVANYVIYRNGVLLDTDPVSPYQDTPPGPGTYSYRVEAVDTSFNFSGQSTPVSITIAGSYKPPGSVNIDGTVDVSTAMATFLATVPDGTAAHPTVIDLKTGATYRMIFDWIFLNRQHLVVNANGAKAWRPNKDGGASTPDAFGNNPYRGRCNVVLNGCTDVTIKGLYAEGPNTTGGFNGDYDPAYEAQHGFWVINSDDCNLLDINVQNVWGDFVACEGGGVHTGQGARRLLVDGLYGRKNGRIGFSVTRGSFVTLQNFDIGDLRRSAFDIEPGNPLYDFATNITIQNGRVGPHLLNFLSNLGNGPCANIKVQNITGYTDPTVMRPGSTTPEGCMLQMDLGYLGGRRSNYTIRNLTSDVRYVTGSGSGAVVRCINLDGLLLTGVQQPVSKTTVMIVADLVDCTNTDVHSNTLTTFLTDNPAWPPGADGQARYRHYTPATVTDPAFYTVLGYSPGFTGTAPPAAVPWHATANLIFNDDFPGTAIDSTKWNVVNNSNFGNTNHELERYFAANVSVSGGTAKLIGKLQDTTNGAQSPSLYHYTSGMITTSDRDGLGPSEKFKFGGGGKTVYVEMRTRLPAGGGYWPAFWLVGADTAPGWPDYGEIDIMEAYGTFPNDVEFTYHWEEGGSDRQQGGAAVAVADNTDWHTYGVEWTPTTIKWFIDGVLKQTLAATTGQRVGLTYEHTIHINLAVGGDGPTLYHEWDGTWDPGTLPGTYEIDYVRVWEKP